MKKRLAKGLEHSNPELAAELDSPTIDISVIEAPFFKNCEIVKLDKFTPHGGRTSFFAIDKKNRVTEIGHNKAAFLVVVHDEPVQLATTEEALAYARLCYEVLRDRSVLSYVVENLTDFRFRPNLEGQDDATKRALESKYQHQIQPIKVKQQGADFHVAYFEISDQKLNKVLMVIATNGDFDFQNQLLEENLPTVYGL